MGKKKVRSSSTAAAAAGEEERQKGSKEARSGETGPGLWGRDRTQFYDAPASSHAPMLAPAPPLTRTPRFPKPLGELAKSHPNPLPSILWGPCS